MSFHVYKDIFTEVFPHFLCLLGHEQSISCRIPVDCFSLYFVFLMNRAITEAFACNRMECIC